jgi:Na+-driven multidrug efflux pump
VIKALGIQRSVVTIAFLGYWIINVPLSYYVTFGLQVGFPGLWIGLLIAMLIIAVCFDILIERTNWSKVTDDAAERLK